MNKVLLIGRFTKDPEMRTSANGLEVARYSIAATGEFVKNGERDVEFINCVSFGQTANLISRFCKKGNLVSVTGRIKNGSYDAKDGSKRYTTDVVVEQIEFLGKNNQGNNPEEVTSEVVNEPNIETTDVSEDPYKDFGEEITLSSDDLPF